MSTDFVKIARVAGYLHARLSKHLRLQTNWDTASAEEREFWFNLAKEALSWAEND